jgi:hypothetical protein
VPEVSYRVPGIPAGPSMGLTAFMPHYNRPAGGGAQSFKYAVSGHPGTRGIAAPADPAAVISAGNLVAGATMGAARSVDAPPMIWPGQYYQTFIAEPPGAGMPIQYYSPTQPGLTTVLPVPANNVALGLRRDSARLSRTTILNRVKQLPWFPRRYEAPNA